MTGRVVVPVQLGCCPDPQGSGRSRCRLCPPSPAPPTTEYIQALVENYRRDRLGPDDVLRVTFFGGPPPTSEWIRAAGVPVTVRVRPDLLSRAEAERLLDEGVREIELDLLSFSDHALKSMRRTYPAARVETMALTLRERGVRVGLVLSPGLPNTSRETAIQDARRAADLADFVRIHPTLVLEHSGLRDWHLEGLYRPLGLAEAVDVCRDMLDILEEAGVEVIRVGLQPGPDGFGHAVAGPKHPAFRQLVESERTLRTLRQMFTEDYQGRSVEILCAGPDETRTRGPLNQHIRTLRAEFRLKHLSVSVAKDLSRGMWRVRVLEACGE
jgi:histone acetyltransferase (RNA polymerase elongator complex component)